ncbi:MAG TPA: hypothetical protein PL105_23550, partial [Caldilineaceae bacterium]|nr:hypothetical protein [Caldilineaceae bacterium]
MLERPTLSDDAIRRSLRENYGISVTQIEFLPIGYDSAASVFRVTTETGTDYFLKTKTVPVAPATLAIPTFLLGRGVEQIVAPLPSLAGALSTPLADGFTAILYPFVEGRMGAKGGLSLAQWTEFGQIVRRVHSAQLPPELAGQMRCRPWTRSAAVLPPLPAA